jgi:hypothetical protein
LAGLRVDEGQPGLEDASPPAQEAEAPPAESEAEMPDWLAALRPTEETITSEEGGRRPEEIIEPEEGELPDWLAELRATQAQPEPPSVEEEAAQPPPPAEEEVSEAEETGALDWLAEIEALEAEPPAVEPEAPSPPAGEALPEMPSAQAPEVEEVPPIAEEATPADIPDWLKEAQPEELELEEPAPPEAEEIPSTEEAVEGEGVLAGLPDLLPEAEEELEEEEAQITPLRSRAAVPEVPDMEGARLFDEIVSEEESEAVPEAEPESARGRILGILLWGLVFIVLVALIAVVLMAVLNQVGELTRNSSDFVEFFGSTAVIDRTPVETFRGRIAQLPSEALVVVSFDYSPATEAEMDPLAEIIVRDLLDRQARIVAVSLRPEGAAMAQRLFNRLDAEYPEAQVLNLGYLPGQTAGVRGLAFLAEAPLFGGDGRAMSDVPSWQDVDGLDDVALVVDVADSPFPVRWWVEQIGPGTQADRVMLAAVSAAADPTVRPYYNHLNPQAGQLLGLVSGVTDAAIYEKRLRQPARAMQSLAAQSVVHLGLVIVALGGTFMGFQSRSKE